MDIHHKDLKDNLYINPNEIPGNGVDDDHNGYIDDVNGWDAVTNTGNIRDEGGHGTHVSGTIGARGNNSEGVVGVNWRVKLLPLRFITVTNGSTFDAAARRRRCSKRSSVRTAPGFSSFARPVTTATTRTLR
jgi:subtilisin family serine protease